MQEYADTDVGVCGEYEDTHVGVCGERLHMHEYEATYVRVCARPVSTATYADATYARSYCYMCVLMQESRLIGIDSRKKRSNRLIDSYICVYSIYVSIHRVRKGALEPTE